MKLPNEISTVNVIVMENGNLTKVRSFPDNEDGNRSAEIVFHDEIVEWHKLQCKDAPLDEEIEAATEDGHYEYGYPLASRNAVEIFLTHSA